MWENYIHVAVVDKMFLSNAATILMMRGHVKLAMMYIQECSGGPKYSPKYP